MFSENSTEIQDNRSDFRTRVDTLSESNASYFKATHISSVLQNRSLVSHRRDYGST